MSSKTTYLVTGATGGVGSHAVNELVSMKHKRVIALVRDASKADDLKDGVDVRVADGINSRQLASAFKGVDVALLVPPNGGDTAKYRKRVIDNYVAAAKKAGVRKVVLLSFHLGPKGSIFHKQMKDAEHAVKGFPEWAILRAAPFFENILGQSDAIKQGQMYGFKRLGWQPMVAIRDVGVAGAHAMVSGSTGVFTLVTEKVATREVIRRLAVTSRHQVEFAQTTEEAFRASLSQVMPEWQVDGVVEMSSTVYKMPATNDFQKITGQKPTKLSDWMRENRRAFTDEDAGSSTSDTDSDNELSGFESRSMSSSE